LLFAYLPAHLLVNLVSLAYFTARGRGGAILRAKRDALRALPDVLRRRRHVQAAARISPWALRRSFAPLVELLARHRP
ncbi:MAG TPA: hypothetical protein VIG50_00305, partial [Vicinamibacteria bacterium]